MPLSNSLFSYDDVRAVLDRALDSENGVRLNLESHGAAVHFRHRAYKFRLLDRTNSAKIFSPGDPKYGTSVYDSLVVTVVDVSILVQKTNVEALLERIEEL